MKRIFLLFALLLTLTTVGMGQGSGSLTVTDNVRTCYNCRKIIFGSITVSGNTATVAGGGGSGDVVGPASATDNAVVRFDSTTGKLVQSSVVTIGDTGDVAGIVNLIFTGILTGGSAPTTITDSTGKILSAALNTVQPAQGGTGITALGTGVVTALGINVGSAGAFVAFNGAGGTPSSLVLTNATGLPPTTGISGWPANASGVLTNNGSGVLSWGAAGGATGANPTASVGLTTVNGVAATFLRSDGAPALDQAIVPTWTGLHTFNNGVTTGSGSTSGTVFNYNSLTTGTGANFSSSSITSGSIVNIVSTSTAGATGIEGLNIAMSGANGTTAQTVTGATISVTNTNATSGKNYALSLAASGATGGAATGPNRAIDVTAGQAVFSDGSNLLPSVAFQTNPGTGMYLISSTIIGWATNVSHAMALNGFDLVIQNNGSLGITSATGTTADVILDRVAAGHWRWGSATDVASPVAQTQSAQNVVAGTSNTAGATWTLRGSLGTSQGAPGRVHLAGGAMIAASGTTQQTAIDRIISGATKVLTNNTAVTITNVTVAADTNAGGVIDYVVEVQDGTDVQYEVGSVAYGVSNKAGVFSGNTVTKFGNHQNATAGTLAVTFAISGANPALLSVNANSSLTPSTGFPRITYTLRNLGQQAVAIQ